MKSIFDTNYFIISILVFEPEVNEENEKEYKTLHGEYKNLVSNYFSDVC